MRLYKRFIPNIFILFLSIILALALAEVFIALFLPQDTLRTIGDNVFFVRYDPEIGWVNKEGASGSYQPNPNMPPKIVRINEIGLRGGPVNHSKPAGFSRILFLGDSNTFGFGLDEEDRYSNILQGLIPYGYESINMGVFGYGTDQELLLFRRNGLDLNPDIVVLGFSAGDVSDNMSSVNAGYSKPYFRLNRDGLVLKNTPVPELPVYMKEGPRRSLIYNLAYSYSHLYRLIMHRLSSSDLYMPDSIVEMSREEGLMTTVSIIKELDEICLKYEARLVVVLIPHEVWLSAEAGRAAVSAGYFPALNGMLSAAGVTVIDSTEQLLKSHIAGERAFMKGDQVHLNKTGNKLVAKALYDGLLQHKIITYNE